MENTVRTYKARENKKLKYAVTLFDCNRYHKIKIMFGTIPTF